MGLDKSLDEVRGRILGTKPLPNLREVFSEVRREESRKRVMLGHQASSIPEIPAFATTKDANLDSGAFVVRSNSQNYNDNRSRKGRPWCDHCRRPGHLKETCWKLHGKPADWKPNKDREARGNVVISGASQHGNSAPFSKEQLEVLQQLMQKGNNHTQTSNSSALHAAKSSSSSWIVDSGASDHMTGDRSFFTT